MNTQVSIDNYTLTVFGQTSPVQRLVIMAADHNEGAAVWEQCRQLGKEDFTLVSISGINWEKDLSPWEAAAVFKNGAAFGNGADAFLEMITKKMIPAICGAALPKETILAGYSLAGLFAVYAAFNTDYFSSIVSASGSLWFPGFLEYANTHTISSNLRKAYFSVGDKEAKTKNPIMQTVEANTRAMAELFSSRQVQASFELNPGNHFVDDDLRLAKGICRVL